MDCICLIGYEGLDGVPCTACGVGKYKSENGSGTCLECSGGDYLNTTAGSSCLACPSNTFSLPGSVGIADCVCNVGYEGVDGAACSMCVMGSYKPVNGSG
eukprot:1706534-Rhodomonas_salina.1